MDSIERNLVYLLVPIPKEEVFSGVVIACDTMRMHITVESDSLLLERERKDFSLEAYLHDGVSNPDKNQDKRIDVVRGLEIEMPYKIDRLCGEKVSVDRNGVHVLVSGMVKEVNEKSGKLVVSRERSGKDDCVVPFGDLNNLLKVAAETGEGVQCLQGKNINIERGTVKVVE
jgi:hypothetical protein